MKLRVILFVICVIVTNCKNEQPKIEYHFSDKEAVLKCETNNDALFNEALYTFEADLANYYAQGTQNPAMAYNRFMKESTNNKTNYGGLANERTIVVLNALKNVDGLWQTKGLNTTLNYNHPIFTCIGNNLQDKDLKTTFNALLSTNSMSKRMLKEPLQRNVHFLKTDKYLTIFVALELYYSNIFDLDLSKNNNNALPKTTDPNEQNDPHAGHNHD